MEKFSNRNLGASGGGLDPLATPSKFWRPKQSFCEWIGALKRKNLVITSEIWNSDLNERASRTQDLNERASRTQIRCLICTSIGFYLGLDFQLYFMAFWEKMGPFLGLQIWVFEDSHSVQIFQNSDTARVWDIFGTFWSIQTRA